MGVRKTNQAKGTGTHSVSSSKIHSGPTLVPKKRTGIFQDVRTGPRIENSLFVQLGQIKQKSRPNPDGLTF